MLAKIIIKRRFRQGATDEILALLHDLRFAAMSQPGYVSGETLMQNDDPRKLVVIGTWQDMESWHRWKNNPRRNEFEVMLNVYQEGPTVYEEYVLGTALR
ncbi:antibiotic biosynthesis monooxygenase family protein [Desulfosudis oleivorans]|nr:antibiotic biosynthesis monooxygenase [Desulfosudis oleivorans]